MVPKVAGKGRSFKGAGLYYLHDKNASTRERVAFTYTQNLPTLDPDKAIKCMAWTALRQQELKARSGGSAKGRKLTQPVYCYSLSWAPGEEPSQDEMILAAKDTLAILGLQEHEALFIGHNDEPHPHIHVIVNRVHPETGIAAPLSMDHLKLSAWAEAFEKRQGQIRCEQRVENNERRRYGEFVKDRDSQHAAEFRRWQRERTARQVDKRLLENAVLDLRHQRERDTLGRERDQKIDAKRKQVREAVRADWRRLYRDQAGERRKLDVAQRNAWTRLRFFVRTYGAEFRAASPATRKNMLKGAFAALIGGKRQYAELEKRQLAARKAQGNKVNALTKQLTRGIKEDHDRKLAELRQRQAAEEQEQRARHSQESQEQARAIKEGRDRQEFERLRDLERQDELKKTKADITQRKEGTQPSKSPLRTQFDAAKSADQPKQKREQSQSKGKGGARSPDRTGPLSEQFREAKEASSEKTPKDRFNQNARDLTKDRDLGRERTLKPPGPKKP